MSNAITELKAFLKTASPVPTPPDLRERTERNGDGSKHCGTCKMFDQGKCWGFGNTPVDKDDVCNDWSPEPKTSNIEWKVAVAMPWGQDFDEWHGTRPSYNTEGHQLGYDPAIHPEGKGFMLDNGDVWTWPTNNLRPMHMEYDQKVKALNHRVIPGSAFHLQRTENMGNRAHIWQYGEGRNLDPNTRMAINQADHRILPFGPQDAPQVTTDPYGHADQLVSTSAHKIVWQPGERGRGFVRENGDVHMWPEDWASHMNWASQEKVPWDEIRDRSFVSRPDGTSFFPYTRDNYLMQQDLGNQLPAVHPKLNWIPYSDSEGPAQMADTDLQEEPYVHRAKTSMDVNEHEWDENENYPMDGEWEYRSPMIYDHGNDTLHLGWPGGTHDELLNRIGPTDSKFAYGWRGPNPDADPADAVSNRGQHNEVGWYQGTEFPRPSLEAYQWGINQGKTAADLYHATPVSERNRILQHGLQPGDPYYQTYNDEGISMLPNQDFHEVGTGRPPVGVYGWPSLEQARDWSRLGNPEGDNFQDIWKFPTEQSYNDPDWDQAQYITHPVSNPTLAEGPEHRWKVADNYTLDSREWPDPYEPRTPSPGIPQTHGCTCHEGDKLHCPVHGMDPTEEDFDYTWAQPQNNPVGYPQDQPRNWQQAHSNVWKTADYYHVAPTVDRERIRQHGLQPASPRQNIDRWGLENDLNEQPTGVYVMDDPELARDLWGSARGIGPMKKDKPHWDTWHVPNTQIYDDPDIDPVLGEGAYVIPHPVYPELHEGGPETYGWPNVQNAQRQAQRIMYAARQAQYPRTSQQ